MKIIETTYEYDSVGRVTKETVTEREGHEPGMTTLRAYLDSDALTSEFAAKVVAAINAERRNARRR